MKTFESYLKEELKNPQFKVAFEKENKRLSLAVKLARERENQNLSQQQLAIKADITQQQLSKVENGINCNVTTLLKVCDALGFRLTVEPQFK